MGSLCSCCNDGAKDPYIRFDKSNDFTNPKYDEEYQESIEKREEFWAKQAKELTWEKEPTVTLEKGEGNNFDKWFTDGEMNIVFNCLDRHVDAELGDELAFLYSSPQSGIVAKLDYDQICANTGKVANVFKNVFGVGQGDQVFFYAPCIPMVLCLMLSCARMGAVHNVCFGGVGAKALAQRLDESNPKLIVVVSGGFDAVGDAERSEENPFKIVKYVPILEEALALCTKADKGCKKLIYQRQELKGKLHDPDVDPEKYTDYKTVCEDDEIDEDDCDMLPSTAPLYVAYTTGTTGQPVGVIRDHGSTAVALNYAMKNVFNITRESVQFAACHQAWSVGLDFMLYGPLLRGCKTVVWEGDCLYPDPGILWELVENNKVTNMYISVSVLHEVRKEDYEGLTLKACDTSSLKTLCLVGERAAADTINWLHEMLPNVVINDTYFCTELCVPIAGQLCDLETFETLYPALPGSVTRALPGFEVAIIGDDGQVCEQEPSKITPKEGEPPALTQTKLGKIAVKRPLPPGSPIEILGTEKDARLADYFGTVPDYFYAGDSGTIDENGFLRVCSRTANIITLQDETRIDTQQIEDSIMERPEVGECAVVEFKSKERGGAPLAFVVLRDVPADEKDLALAKPESEKEAERKAAARQIRKNVNTDCGENARLLGVIFVADLPKTRCGHVMRKAIGETLASGSDGCEADHPFLAQADSMCLLKKAFDEWSEPTAESTLSEKENKNRGCF